MCFSLLIATGSFFRGQQQVFPAAVRRKANVLFVPAFLPLFMLIFWRFRVWFTSSPEMAHDAPQPERPVFPSPRLAVAHAVTTIVSLAATKTLPDSTRRGQPLRQVMAAAPNSIPTMPAEI
jgi:hypothetical protein